MFDLVQHPPHAEIIKKLNHRFTKKRILYRSMIRNLYHLVLVVGVWLLKRLKIFENLSGFQGSATIDAGITGASTLVYARWLVNYI